jgi:hypothetical protein
MRSRSMKGPIGYVETRHFCGMRLVTLDATSEADILMVISELSLSETAGGYGQLHRGPSP